MLSSKSARLVLIAGSLSTIVVGCSSPSPPERVSSGTAALTAVQVQLPAALGGGQRWTAPPSSEPPALPHVYGSLTLPLAIWTPADESASNYPPATDLSTGAPPAGDQGQTGSCQSWASGYTLMSWWAARSGVPNAQFAPMYLYAQIAQGKCEKGALIEESMHLLKTQGIDTLTNYEPMEESLDCATQPNTAQRANAKNFQISDYKSSLFFLRAPKLAIQAELAAGHPVVIGFEAYAQFENANASNYFIDAPKSGEQRLGAHAVTAFSYDDQGVWILNSWGTSWGLNGWAELSWAFISGHVGLIPNVADVVAVTGVQLACADSDAQCAFRAATGQCANAATASACCASCANPNPCLTDPARALCDSLGYDFHPAAHRASCLGVTQDVASNSLRLVEGPCDPASTGAFSVEDAGDGQVSFAHVQTGRCVSIDAGSTPQLDACDGSAGQRFVVEPQGGGAVTIMSPSSGKCLELSGGSSADGTPLQLGDCDGATNQKWFPATQGS